MCAAKEVRLAEYRCEYCVHPMKFQEDAKGQKAECPNCGRTVLLGMVSPAFLEMHKAGGTRVRRVAQTRIRSMTLRLGWPLFATGFLSLLSSMVTPLLGGETAARALSLFLSLLATGVGLALMLESRNSRTYWACSVCEARLPSPNVINCSTCDAELE